MTSPDIWADDIQQLRTFGERTIKDLANDLDDTAARIPRLRLSPQAFGDNDLGSGLNAAYENATTAVHKAVERTADQVHQVGRALVRIAENYRALEEGMS